jgi:hypothetical protein
MLTTLITLIKITLLIISLGLFVYGVWTEQRAAHRYTRASRDRSRRYRSLRDLPPAPTFRLVWLGMDMCAITYAVWMLDRARTADLASVMDVLDFYTAYFAVPGVLWGEFRAYKTFGIGPLSWAYQQSGLDVARRFAVFRWLEGKLEDAAREPFRPPANLLVFALGVPVFTLMALLPLALILLISPFTVLWAMWAFWFPR